MNKELQDMCKVCQLQKACPIEDNAELVTELVTIENGQITRCLRFNPTVWIKQHGNQRILHKHLPKVGTWTFNCTEDEWALITENDIKKKYQTIEDTKNVVDQPTGN